jgi:hypothetical protein
LSISGRKYPRDLYYSTNIRVIKLEMIGWRRQMGRRGKKGNECRALKEERKEIGHLEDLDAEGG